LSRDSRNFLTKMISPHRNIIRCTISRGKDPNNKNEPYTDRSTFSRLYIFVVVRKKSMCRWIWRYLITLELQQVTSENEKRSSSKTLSFDIVFARPAERYRNAITRQMQRRTNVNLTTKSPRRILDSGIKVHVSETIYLSDYRYGIAS